MKEVVFSTFWLALIVKKPVRGQQQLSQGKSRTYLCVMHLYCIVNLDSWKKWDEITLTKLKI